MASDVWTILAAARRTPPLPNPARNVAVVTRRLTEAFLSRFAPPVERPGPPPAARYALRNPVEDLADLTRDVCRAA